MSDEALQKEEEVVLNSIYEGDKDYKQVNAVTYQYKFVQGKRSFVVEVSWGPTYPSDKPIVNLDLPANETLLQCVKAKIIDRINTDAEMYRGTPMTYTLIENLKDHFGELLIDQPEPPEIPKMEKKPAPKPMATATSSASAASSSSSKAKPATAPVKVVKKPTKEQEVETARLPNGKKCELTKSQKRRAWDKAEIGKGGEKPRGWDLVDIIKHLSQVPHHRQT